MFPDQMALICIPEASGCGWNHAPLATDGVTLLLESHLLLLPGQPHDACRNHIPVRVEDIFPMTLSPIFKLESAGWAVHAELQKFGFNSLFL